MNKLLRLNKLVIPVVFSLFVFSSCNEKRNARSNESSYNGRVVVPEQTVYFLDMIVMKLVVWRFKFQMT